MFEVKPYKVIIKDLHKIVSNLSVLFNDGENDIIYTGTNPYSNRVLGVIMFDDDEEGYLRYLHVLTTDKQYYSFIDKTTSLRNIIEENESVFIVDKTYGGEEITANIVPVREIPEDFLPLPNSFCPEFIKEASFAYGASMKGNNSDLHLVTAEDLNEVNSKFSQFIKTATEFVQELDIDRKVFIEALPAGSFQIKFKIEVKKRSGLFYNLSIDELATFINDYFNYILSKLPKENSDIFKNEEITSKDFLKLEEEMKSLYEAQLLPPPPDIAQKIVDNIAYSIENLKNINYNGSFNRIEFINYTKAGQELPVALINEEYIPNVERKLFPIEQPTVEDKIEEDEVPQTYTIQVYLLNKESGNGGAYLHTTSSIEKVLLHLRGRQSYENTVFTKNMDEGKLMEIKAIGKRINGKVKELTFNFE
jgi:hypothetical protein